MPEFSLREAASQVRPRVSVYLGFMVLGFWGFRV